MKKPDKSKSRVNLFQVPGGGIATQQSPGWVTITWPGGGTTYCSWLQHPITSSR